MSRLLKDITHMKPIVVLGIVFLAIGVVILLLQFVTLTTQIKGIHIGPFSTDAEAKTTFPVSPFLGGLVFIVGIALFIIGHKKKK